jgi:hypothetical protein
MKKSDEIFTIECTIRNIFNKDVIKKIDVAMANNLLKKWKVLTNHIENTESPIKDNILEEEPNYKSINN